MSSGPKFQPVFGPNGAVMNAPAMTPEMRAKFDDLEKPPAKRQAWLYFMAMAAFVLAAPAIGVYAPKVLELIKTSPWWAGVATGVVASALVVNIVWAVWMAIRRWELLASPYERELHMPAWGRSTLAVCDIVHWTARGAMFVALMLSLTLQSVVAYVIGGAAIAVIVAAMVLSALLRHMAGKLGWIWRVER